MTSQDPVTSESHTFQDHHGDVRSRLQSAARADRFLFLCIFRTVPRPFPVSLFLSFLLSFCFFEIERFQFPFLVSLLFLFMLVHGHFCSVVVGVSISQPPFPSSQHFLRKIHKHDECWLQGDLLVTCTIWRNESATLTQLCQNTSFRRLQVCCRGGSAAGGQQANSSSIVGWRESTLTNENNKNPRYLIADLKSHVKLALPCELTRQNRRMHAGLPRRRTTTRSPRVRVYSKLSKATLTSRTEKIRRQNIRLNSCSFILKERSDSDDMVRQKKFEETTKVTCWWCRDADVFQVRDRSRSLKLYCPRRRAWDATVLHDNNTED